MGTMQRVPGDASGRLKTAMAELNQSNVRVGWFESARYNDDKATPVAYVAAINELGPHARPFMRTAKDESEAEWNKTMEALSRQILNGKLTALDALELLGYAVGADIKEKIATIQDPPLSLITLIARKYRLEGRKVTGGTIGQIAQYIKNVGDSEARASVSGISTKPLNDTGYMLATLSASVNDGSPKPVPE